MDDKKRARGFALMTEERRREVASAGGRAAHAAGKAHRFDGEDAKVAGAKGGASVSRDREHMRKIGRAGGEARAKKKREESAR